MAGIRILGAADVRRALPMADAIAGMKEAYARLSAGQAEVPLRTRIGIPEHGGVALFMPAFLPGRTDLAIKIVGVYPNNASRGEPVIYAIVLVMDATSGRPLAMMEGGALTAIRTGAGSGAATDILARPDASTVAILGSGVQARTQLEAVCTVRFITSVRVYSPNYEHARVFAHEMAGHGPIPERIRVATSPAEAVKSADILCVATTSNEPVFDGEDLMPGAHINAVGSFTPEMQEVDLKTIERSLVVVDSRQAVMEEAGDLVRPIEAGDIDEGHIYAELGEIVNGQKAGRTSRNQITYFKSVGVAVQDVVAAGIALSRATELDLGINVQL